MAEADDGYTYAQKVRRVRTVALGDPTLVKLEYISIPRDKSMGLATTESAKCRMNARNVTKKYS